MLIRGTYVPGQHPIKLTVAYYLIFNTSFLH